MPEPSPHRRIGGLIGRLLAAVAMPPARAVEGGSRLALREVAAAAVCIAALGRMPLGSAAAAEAEQRFDRTGCGSIIDRATQLEWYLGPDRNLSWSESVSWVRNLRACGGDWRMPSFAQLRRLFDARSTAGTGYFTRGRHWPAHLNPVFSGIGAGSWVWANEAARLPGAGYPAFNFNQGINVALEPGRDYTVRAFAVKRSVAVSEPASTMAPEGRVPVVIEATPGSGAACGKGVVFDLDPHGDGFLAVKSGPGLQFLRIDKLYNGEEVYLCAQSGPWYGIVYTREAQDCNVDRAWPLSEPYTGPCRHGWAHGRWIKAIASPAIAQANPAPTAEPVVTDDNQIEALLARARKEKNPRILKRYVLSHAGAAEDEEVKRAYIELSDHLRSHPFGALEKLKIYEKPDIQSTVIRQDPVGNTYVHVRREGDFDYIEYDMNKYGYIYHGFLN
jgi:hypothetical protein